MGICQRVLSNSVVLAQAQLDFIVIDDHGGALNVAYNLSSIEKLL